MRDKTVNLSRRSLLLVSPLALSACTLSPQIPVAPLVDQTLNPLVSKAADYAALTPARFGSYLGQKVGSGDMVITHYSGAAGSGPWSVIATARSVGAVLTDSAAETWLLTEGLAQHLSLEHHQVDPEEHTSLIRLVDQAGDIKIAVINQQDLSKTKLYPLGDQALSLSCASCKAPVDTADL